MKFFQGFLLIMVGGAIIIFSDDFGLSSTREDVFVVVSAMFVIFGFFHMLDGMSDTGGKKKK